MNNHAFMALHSPLPSLHYPTPPASAHHSVTHFGHYPSQPSISAQGYGPNVGQYPSFSYDNGAATPSSPSHSMVTPVSSQVVSNPATVTTANGYASSPGNEQQYPHHHQVDTTGQVPPPGIRPRVTATLWEDEGTLCYQVEAKGLCVARRGDNNMINGTKLLNVAGMTRGRRDGILKSEKLRQVVKIGPMHLKGVWIPYERALEFANKERITDLLYPLFVHNINALLFNPSNGTRVSAYIANQRKPSGESSNTGNQHESNQNTPQQSSGGLHQVPSPALHSQGHHNGQGPSMSDRSHHYHATSDGNTSPTAHSNGQYGWPNGVHTHDGYTDPRGVPSTPTTAEGPVHPVLNYAPVPHPVHVPSYDTIRNYYNAHGSSMPSRWGAPNYGPARIPSRPTNNYSDAKYRPQARESSTDKPESASNGSDLSSQSNDDAESSNQSSHGAEDIYTASSVRAPYPNYALSMAAPNEGLRIVPKLDLGPRNSQSYRPRADSQVHERPIWSPTSPSFGSPLRSPTGCYPPSEASRPVHTTGTMASSLYSIMGETQNRVSTASSSTNAMSQENNSPTTNGGGKPSSPSLPKTADGDSAAIKLASEAPSGKYSPPFNNKRTRDAEDVTAARETERGRAGRSVTISHAAGSTSAVASVGQTPDVTDKSCEGSGDACKRRRTIVDGARPKIGSPLSNGSASATSNGASASQQ